MGSNARALSVNREMPRESTLIPTNLSALCTGQKVARAHSRGQVERAVEMEGWETDDEMGDGRPMRENRIAAHGCVRVIKSGSTALPDPHGHPSLPQLLLPDPCGHPSLPQLLSLTYLAVNHAATCHK